MEVIMRLAAHMTLILLLAAAGCGGSSTAPGNNNTSNGNNPPPQTGPSTSNAITVGNNWFDPGATTVPVGTTVTWTWNSCSNDGYGGQTCTSHTVTFDDGQASSSQSGGTWSRTFNVAGTYKYHCSIHGTAMSGTITVQ
jgi:plastocyanin